MLRVERVLETSLYVEDLEAAERFYRRVLGLEPFAHVEGRHLFYRCGEGVLLLFQPDATLEDESGIPKHGAKGPGHAAFAVGEREIPVWRNRLVELGVEIEKELDWPGGGKSIYFRDPSGNSLEFATPSVWSLE